MAQRQLLTALWAAALATALAAPALAALPAGEAAADQTDTAPRGRLGKPDKDDDAFGDLVAQSLAAVLVILVLGGVGIVVVRRFLPRLGVGQGRAITVAETVHLGTNRTLYLVRVGDRTLLVGASKDRVNLVADLTGSVSFEEAARQAEALPDAPPDGGAA